MVKDDYIGTEGNDKNDEKWEPLEDLSLLCGMLFMSACIFLMRNISILAGTPLPFSGNNGMKYMELELWRFVFFFLSILLSSVLTFVVRKKTQGILSKAVPYIKLFAIGIAIVIGFELFFWRLAYEFSL